MIHSDISLLEEKIGYQYQNKALLQQALTHSSFANEQKINKGQDYERLEFLGDAVLELVSSEFLFKSNPDMPEGRLTRLRSSMVCEPALAYCAKDLQLHQFIRLGKGEEQTGGRRRDSIVSDVMEAVIGSLYLDGGLAVAKSFIDRFILSDLDHKILFYDAKTVLQEKVQENPKNTLQYCLVREEGPDHEKIFEVEALINGVVVSSGSGKTKKAAEQHAAYDAILKLRQQEED